MEYVLNPFGSKIELYKDDIVTNLDKGLISVKSLETEDISDLKKHMQESQNLQLESYVPISLTLSSKLLGKYSNNERAEVISALQNIFKEVFNAYYSSPIKYVNVTIQEILDEIIYIFTPYTTFSTLLYENPQHIQNINIDKYIGYTLLSTSLLTRYVVENLQKQNLEYTSNNIKYINTPNGYISLIPLFPNSSNNVSSSLSNNTYNDEIISRIEDNILKYVKEGYFAYPIGMHDLEDVEAIKQLCSLYDIFIIDDRDLSILICQTTVDFRVTPQEWIRYNLPIIKSGEYPTFTFSFDFSFFNDYNRLYGTSFHDTILKYAAYLAYTKLSEDSPIISSSITSISINNDLSITVALPSYSLASQMKLYMMEYLSAYKPISINVFEEIKHNNTSNGEVHTFVNSYFSQSSLIGKSKNLQKHSETWNIETCKNLREGIIKRWMIQSIDEDADPMLFKDKSDTEVLIHRSHIIDIHTFNFSEENLKLAEETLTSKLRAFYTKCHDNIEAVSLEIINEMDLDELLELIPIEEKGKTYCFSNSTIENLQKLENPLTRRPLSTKTILTKQYLEEGLRGLFDIGPLFGLYPSIPLPIKEKIDIGIIKMTREYVNENRRDLVGNIYLVEVLFEDERHTFGNPSFPQSSLIEGRKDYQKYKNETSNTLFEISLPTVNLERVSQLREYVNTLWYSGYFLSNWETAVVKYLKPKSIFLLNNNSILLHASDSIFDGNIAFEMLGNAI
jgi:hypothetical protein